jgi:Transglycosylase
VKVLRWLSFLLLLCSVLVVPALYFYAASQLPPLESEFDVERLLRFDIEGERMSATLGRYARETSGLKFDRPELARIPKDLVALYLSQRGCPTFFQTPREQSGRWAWRMFSGVWGNELAGDGWCERLLAMRLAERIGAQGILQGSIGGSRIRRFLTKDQLVAYDLSTLRFEHGVVGIEAGAQRLFRRRLEELQLSELAELALAMPPHNFYPQMTACQNATLIRQNRDFILRALSRDGLVSPDGSKNAQAQPVACTKRQ